MKPIKLNYRHSIKTMREQLAPHNATINVYGQDGHIVHELLEYNAYSRGLTQVCGVFYNASDCADYINKKNGVK